VRLGSAEERHLALVWEDADTQLVLHFPRSSNEGLTVEVADRPDGRSLAERVERSRAWDSAERRARLAAAEPFVRLERELGQIKLGESRADILERFAATEAVLKQELPDGLLVTYPVAPLNVTFSVRELYVHFDGAQEVDEVRLRYVDVGDQPVGGSKGVVKALTARLGVPETLTASATKKEVASRWQDDVTCLICIQESNEVDLHLRARPVDQDGAAHRPVAYLPRGTEGCLLGLSEEELMRTLKPRAPTRAGQPYVVPTGDGAYDALLAWVDKGRVVRIVARHREPAAVDSSPEKMAKALTQAWSREATVLGWPSRQERLPNGHFHAWSSHDDRTRVRIFWTQSLGEAPRLYTEWTLAQ
jgi:hypothetical protein